MSGFRSWATLETVGKAVDLTLKLAALVAVLAVLNFFKGRGDVVAVSDCWAPIGGGQVDQVIAETLNLTRAQAEIPVGALQAWSKEPAVPLMGAGDSMRIGCGRSLAAVEDLRSDEQIANLQASLLGRSYPGPSLSDAQRKRRMRLLRREYPDAGDGLVHYVPAFAVVIAAAPELSVPQVRKVLRYIEAARRVTVIVTVRNVGKADALSVKIPPPGGFELLERHPSDYELPDDYAQLAEDGVQPLVFQSDPSTDLSPGEVAYFIFTATGTGSTRTVTEADVVPEAVTEPGINVGRQLGVFALLVVLILVPLVVKDVRRVAAG